MTTPAVARILIVGLFPAFAGAAAAFLAGHSARVPAVFAFCLYLAVTAATTRRAAAVEGGDTVAGPEPCLTPDPFANAGPRDLTA